MYTIEEIKNENSCLNQVLIKNDKLKFQSSIYPNLGASIQQLMSNGIDIIDGISNNLEGLEVYKNKFNSSFLFPFPNRISNGEYSFKNKEYQLPCNEASLNNSLHGDVFNKSFSITNQVASENHAQITFSYSNNGTMVGFPFPYQLNITYTFTPNNLKLDFKVTNTGDNEFPFGLGWHPYFKTSNLKSSILNFKGEKQYYLDEKNIPQQEIPLKFETPLLMEDTFLDDCFIINKPETTFKTEAYEIGIDFSSETEKNFLQVYTPPTRNCIAIEPMTCAPNSFNNKHGLLTLIPNKEYHWKVNLSYSN